MHRTFFLILIIIVTCVLTVVCVVHVIYIGYYNFYPEFPSVRVFKTDLKDIIFPISFKICVEDITENQARFEKLGYWSEWHYFLGQSKFNDKKIGWNGHTENGSTLGSAEKIWSTASLDWRNILLALKVFTKDREHVLWNKDLKLSMADFRGCKLINLHHYFDMSQIVPTSIRFQFAQQENRIVSVKMQDSKKATLRALNSNHFNYNGPPILIDDLLSPFFMTYALKISNFVDLETDKGKKCANYPNKKHESCLNCDEDFVHKEIQRTYNIVPFWASKSNAEVTSSK